MKKIAILLIIAIVVIIASEIYAFTHLFPALDIVMAFLGRGFCLLMLVLWMLAGIYYYIYFQTLDRLWPFRKRLWTQGELSVLTDDEHYRTDPLIWSKSNVQN